MPEDALLALELKGANAHHDDPTWALAALVGLFELDFAFVPCDAWWAGQAVVSLHDADAAAFWSVGGVFGRAAERFGWTEALRLTASEPGVLASVLAEELHAALNDVRAGVAAGADAIVIADDLAGAAGFLMSPDFALDALMPCYRRLAAEASAAGLGAVFHSDGDVRAIYPALAHAGFTGVHLAGLGEEGIEISLAAASLHGLTVLGGIEVASLASEGVGRCGRRVARLVRADGLLACDDGGAAGGDDVVMVVSALEAVRRAYAGEAE